MVLINWLSLIKRLNCFLTLSPRCILSFITVRNSLWLRQSSPSMSKSLKTVSKTLSESSWPVAIITARLNWATGQQRDQECNAFQWLNQQCPVTYCNKDNQLAIRKKSSITMAIQISLTQSYWLAGINTHLDWDGEVLQMIGKETEFFKFIKGDALTKTKTGTLLS